MGVTSSSRTQFQPRPKGERTGERGAPMVVAMGAHFNAMEYTSDCHYPIKSCIRPTCPGYCRAVAYREVIQSLSVSATEFCERRDHFEEIESRRRCDCGFADRGFPRRIYGRNLRAIVKAVELLNAVAAENASPKFSRRFLQSVTITECFRI